MSKQKNIFVYLLFYILFFWLSHLQSWPLEFGCLTPEVENRLQKIESLSLDYDRAQNRWKNLLLTLTADLTLSRQQSEILKNQLQQTQNELSILQAEMQNQLQQIKKLSSSLPIYKMLFSRLQAKWQHQKILERVSEKKLLQSESSLKTAWTITISSVIVAVIGWFLYF